MNNYDCGESAAGPRVWLEFRIFDDGLSATPAAAPRFATFPQFGRLPAELRLKIWACLVQPRIVVVCCLVAEDEDEGGRQRLQRRREELARRARCTGVPALLHVNRESRDVGLSHYELVFGWSIPTAIAGTSASRPPRVYFNYALDALYMTGELGASSFAAAASAATTNTNTTAVAANSGLDGYSLAHYLRKDDVRRVRHVACAFAELGYTERESLEALVRLSRVAGHFSTADRLLLTVSDEDEEQMKGRLPWGTGNAMQRLWHGWMSGTTIVDSTMANKQMLLIKEDDLVEFVASHQG